MKKPTPEQLLWERIDQLQLQQQAELAELKTEVHYAVQRLNPFASFAESETETTSGGFSLTDTILDAVSPYLFRNKVLHYFEQPIRGWLQRVLKRFIG